MKKIDKLCEGIREIAENHNFKSNCDYKEDCSVCIFGGCNAPTLADVRMLCEVLEIDSDNIGSDDFGITVYLDGWLEIHGNEEYEPTGCEFWRRHR